MRGTYIKIPILEAQKPATGTVYLDYHWWAPDQSVVVYSHYTLESLKAKLRSQVWDFSEVFSLQANRDIKVIHHLHPDEPTYLGPVYISSICKFLKGELAMDRFEKLSLKTISDLNVV